MNPINFRNAVLSEPRIFGGQYSLNTPSGIVTTSQPPPLPPKPYLSGTTYGMNHGQSRFGLSPYGGYSGIGGGGYFAGSLGGYGGGYGGFSNSVYNNYSFGSGICPEHRFIQMVEENSRPAFQNIESLVGAIGNIATMLDSTFFALTSSFRAILGVAANFAHLRGVFAQLWTSFALFRWMIWLYRKVLYILKITKTDPTTKSLNEAYKCAETIESVKNSQKKGSSLPVVLFLGFIMSAPYLLMKLFGNGEKTEQSKNPRLWRSALEAVAIHNFDSSNQSEITIRTGQNVLIAPKEVQIEHNLLHTGWVLATVDNTISGLIPISYVQGLKQQLPQQEQQQQQQHIQSDSTKLTHPNGKPEV